MKRFALALVLSVPIALFVAPPVATSSAAGPPANVWIHEPLVIWDVTGSTIGGFVHQHMAVYSDGFVTYFSQGGDTQSAQGGSTFNVDPQVAVGLLRDLANVGALSLADQPFHMSETPLKTVTVFRPSQAGFSNSIANTFSYWSSVDSPYQAAESVIGDFITTHLP